MRIDETNNTIEKQLKLGEFQYRRLFDHNPLPSFLYNSESLEILDVNNSAIEQYQYSCEEFLKMSMKELCLPEEIPSLMEYLSEYDHHHENRIWHHKKRDGTIMDVEIRDCALDYTRKGHHVAFVRDITELKFYEKEKEKLQTQLFLSRKITAAGQLAGAIAHDFNNILTTLAGYGSLLEMELPEDSPLKAYVEEILVSSDQAARLTQTLLAFNRSQSAGPKECNLNNIITDIRKLLKKFLMEDITLITNLTEDHLNILADISQINQIIINISANARDAMPDGGTLTIDTKLLNLDAGFIETHGAYRPGKYACLSISDTGIGMNDKIKERIFDPFFTTKINGQGTGLGLSVVSGIVKEHNGFITVQSKENRGTTFDIYIPILDKPTVGKQHISFSDIGKGAETILFAEDNENVRKLAREVLERTGYTVIEAVDGEDAIRRFLENMEKIDFLIIDAVMPKKNGKAVYNEIKKTKPDMKALFTSGYTKDVLIEKGMCSASDNFLLKPLSPNELLQKVREIINK